VVSDRAAAYLRSRRVDGAKILVARHWFDDSAFKAERSRNVRAEFALDGRFVAMFAGNLGLVQGLETLVDAAARLRDRADIVFAVVGDGSDRARLEARVRELQLTNVRFLGHQPASAMPDFYSAADALIVHLKRSEIADVSIPTKILAYLAAGRPIVCASGGAGADLMAEAGAGPIVEPGDAGGLAAAVASLSVLSGKEREQLGARGRRYFDEHFERARVIDFYERALADLAGRAD
jgi:colanic acid biosynthesis glycosyl transferase WcaI